MKMATKSIPQKRSRAAAPPQKDSMMEEDDDSDEEQFERMDIAENFMQPQQAQQAQQQQQAYKPTLARQSISTSSTTTTPQQQDQNLDSGLSLNSILKTQLANGLFPSETLKLLGPKIPSVAHIRDAALKQGITDFSNEIQSLLVTLFVCLFVERKYTSSNDRLTWNLIVKKARSYVSKSSSNLKIEMSTLQSIVNSLF